MSVGGDEKTQVVDRSSIKRPESKRLASLIVVAGGPIGARIPLEGGGLIIGRSSSCELVIASDDVSREHARIDASPGEACEVVITDLSSTNGTYVNDNRIKRSHSLDDGDQIRIGDWVFKYLGAESREGAFHEAMRERFSLDPLTGCLNRRALWQLLRELLCKASQSSKPLSLCFIDLDSFKAVNDTWGHPCGDEVLKELVRQIRCSAAPGEELGRYGGEEFVILLPETDLVEAAKRAERVRELVANSRTSWQGEQISVTVSIGVAATSELGQAITHEALLSMRQQLIDAADRKLYQAKRAGKDRVVI